MMLGQSELTKGLKRRGCFVSKGKTQMFKQKSVMPCDWSSNRCGLHRLAPEDGSIGLWRFSVFATMT